MKSARNLLMLASVIAMLLVSSASCGAETPQIVEKEVVVEKKIVETVIVEKIITQISEPLPKQQVFTWADSSALLARVPCCEATVDKNTRWLLDQLFDGLVQYKPGTSEIEPSLAKSWEISEDGLTWIFHLRGGVTFNDGTLLTAEAVKYSLDLAMSPESKVTLRIGGLKEVRIVDNYTVALATEQPNAALLHGLQEVGGLVQAPNSTPQNPIGTGPYVLVEWNRGEKIVLERRNNYWGKTPPLLERLIYLKRPEETTRVIQLLNGEIDMAAKLSPETIIDLAKTAHVTVETPTSSMQVRINLNNRVPPYDDQLVRQAFNYAVDKEAIVKNLLLGAGYVPNGVAGQGVWGTLYQEGELYSYDLERAGELLREAGLTKKNGKWYYESSPLLFRLYVPEGRYLKDSLVGEFVAQQLQDFGIEVQLEVAPWTIAASQSRPRLIAKEIDGWLSGFSLLHPVVNWANHFHCRNKDRLETGYCNPEFDTLVDRAEVSFVEEEQRKLYGQAQRLLIEEAPVLWLYGQAPIWGVRSNITGLQFTPNEIPITFGVMVSPSP